MSRAFRIFSATAAVAVAVLGFAYSALYTIALRGASRPALTVSWLLLALAGLATLAVQAALYERLRDVEPGFALLALLLGSAGALGSLLHGAGALAVLQHGANNVLPSPVDPAGLSTFGLVGLALLAWSASMLRSRLAPKGLGGLGLVAGALLVLTYFGRLLVFDPSNPLLLVPAALAGFLAVPAWYLGTAFVLSRDAR